MFYLNFATHAVVLGLKADKNHRLCCPFHNDKTPSLQVYPKTNTWTCFNSNCNAGSRGQIDFIMKKENISKPPATARILSRGDTV
ncbi:MAG: hypothetical protein IT235_03070 [Bacteroidia bacterium]|nr:hypothetical protein [Bacteroidia bacterium]